MKDLKISIIIPTYNRPDDLKNCLESLEKQTVFPYEAIIIDDNSTVLIKPVIDSFKKNKKLNLKYYRNKENLRQSISKNIGVKVSKGNIVAFLDDDCIPNKEWIENAKNIFEKRDIDALSGKIKNLEGKNKFVNRTILTIKYFPSFLFHPIKFYLTGRLLKSGFVSRNFESNREQFIDWGSAGNLFVKKEIFNQLGGFPEFLQGHVAYEEPFLFLKGYKKIKILYVPNVEVYHNFSYTGRGKRNVKEEFQNYKLFFQKFNNKFNLLFSIQGGWLKLYNLVISAKF